MTKYFKRIGAVILAGVLTVTLLTNAKTVSVAADKEVTGLTANEICNQISMGFNIGNTMEAIGGNKNNIYSYETSWGNPKINKELIHGIKEAGFTFVRIPITWQRHIADDGKNTIDAEWLERVKTVVDYCYEEDLYVIINIHHDDTWLNVGTLTTDYKKIGVKLADIWSQLADYFAEYDQRLIFEAMNEPRAKGTDYEWTGNAKGYEAINYLDQVFVNTIRGNKKGHNSERALMIPGYAASSNHEVLESIKIPEWNGKKAENIIVAVHCYSPYNFCLSDNQLTFNPDNDGDTADIKRIFKDIKNLFLDNNIPVIFGECGATRHQNDVAEREKWLDYFGGMCREYKVPACIWDNGVDGKTGGENHCYILRKDGSIVYPELVTAFISGIPPKDMFIDFEPIKMGTETVTKTPRDYGMSPNSIRGQIRTNHTADVKVGYSAKVDSTVKENTAYLDLSSYSGTKLKISAFLFSDDVNAITLGIEIGEEKTEYTSVDLNGTWKGAGFAVELPKGDSIRLYFKGTEGKGFYIDDISVEIVDSIEGITFDFPEEKQDETETSASVSTSTDNSVVTSDDTTVDKDDKPVKTEKNDTVTFARIIVLVCVIIAALAAVVACGASLIEKSKKNK